MALGRKKQNHSCRIQQIIIDRLYYALVIVIALLIAESKSNINRSVNNNVCTTPECFERAAQVLKNMDESVNPCDDFYEFACGGFINKSEIPSDRHEVNSVTMLYDLFLLKLKSIYEEPQKSNEPKPFSLVKKLYRLCMNTSSINNGGLTEIKDMLKGAGSWPILEGKNWNETEFDWKTSTQTLMRLGFKMDGFISFEITSNPTDLSARMIKITLPEFIIPREILMQGLKDKTVESYYNYLIGLSTYFGVAHKFAASEARDVINFNIQLANINIIDRYEDLYYPMTVADIQKLFPSINWLGFINSIVSRDNINITNNETINVITSKYIHDLLNLLNRTSKRIQANYAFFLATYPLVTYLPRNESVSSRGAECAGHTAKALDWVVSALYVRRYFNETLKQETLKMVADIKNALVQMIKKQDWLDETTRKLAVEKASSITAHIGFPNEILNDTKLEDYYAKLNFNSDSFLEVMNEIDIFKRNKEFSQLKLLVKDTEWNYGMSAVTLNAMYDYDRNRIQLPAIILQEIFLNTNQSHYMNYGALGQIIGHEVVHGFTGYGKIYDKEGNLMNWLTNETYKIFKTKTHCFKDQYSAITVPELGINLNGKKTHAEDISDNGGITAAYLAYSKWIEDNGAEPTLPGLNFTPKQMFWISAANLYCSKLEIGALRNRILIDVHSPWRYRILLPFRNSNYFANDFNCPVESKMNTKDKCKVW